MNGQSGFYIPIANFVSRVDNNLVGIWVSYRHLFYASICLQLSAEKASEIISSMEIFQKSKSYLGAAILFKSKIMSFFKFFSFFKKILFLFKSLFILVPIDNFIIGRYSERGTIFCRYSIKEMLTLSHIQQICSRQLWNYLGKNMQNHPKNQGINTEISWKHCGKSHLLQMRQKASICGKG